MKYLLLIFLACTIFSCEKTEFQEPPGYSEASYKMTITMNWTSPQFIIPPGAHITTIMGMTHSRDTFLWKETLLSTPGLEDVAEIGNTVKMNAEIDGIISKSKARSKFQIPPPSITGTSDTTLKFTTLFPHISFASMIAPSPDWFMGISNVSLFENNKWIKELTLNIRLYDAGTEEGNVFGYSNPATIPQQKIMLLTPASVLVNNTTSIAPIATVRFVKD